MEGIIEGLQVIVDFFTHDMWVFIYEVFTQIASWMVIWVINVKIFFVQFSWDTAKVLLENYGLSDQLNQAWSHIDSKTISYLTYFRLIEAINILLQAAVTRFVLNVVGAGIV